MKKKEIEKISSEVSRQLQDARVSQDVINNIIYRLSVDNPTTPWYIIVLKVIAYAIGLILAGYGTTAAAAILFLH